MKLLGISGTILGAKTGILVESVLQEVKRLDSNVEVDILDLRDYHLQFCDGRSYEKYNDDTKAVIDKVTNADFYLIGTPVFNGSIPAPLKNVIDLVNPNVFRHKVMGFVATGGTYQHYLVIENQLKPIAGYLRAFVTPSYVYIKSEDFSPENTIEDSELKERITFLAEELITMQKGLKGQTVK